ncbi:MAG: MOSC domain-containing protein [Candidatus Heimdallarchaeaceae archaeon]
MNGTVLAVNISPKRELPKKNVHTAEITNLGLKGDSHSGNWDKQVSLLSIKSIHKLMKNPDKLNYGDLFENLTIDGIELHNRPIGTKIKINETILEIVQIGKPKEQFSPEEYYEKRAMVEEGIFAKVIQPGTVSVGDKIEILSSNL